MMKAKKSVPVIIEDPRQRSLNPKDYAATSFEGKLLRMIEKGVRLGEIARFMRVSNHALSKRILRRFGRSYTQVFKEFHGQQYVAKVKDEFSENVVVYDVHDTVNFQRLIEQTARTDPEHAAWMRMVANQVRIREAKAREAKERKTLIMC